MIQRFLNHNITVSDVLLTVLAISTAYLLYPHQQTSPQQVQNNQHPVAVHKVEPEIKTDSTTLYKVTEVVDGDTIKIKVANDIATLRLIGIDTPETKDPRKPVQCFAEEASAKARELLTGKSVYVEADPSQGERDKYNRLLRYVFFDDHTSYHEKMIRDGYAHEYTYNLPYKYQSVYKEAEKYARGHSLGLWSGKTCNGDTKQPKK